MSTAQTAPAASETAVAEAPATEAQTQTAVAEVNEILATAPAVPVSSEVRNDPDAFMLTEDQIDSTHYKNPRGEIKDDAAEDMMNDLKLNGQLQHVGVGSRLSTGKYPTIYGYTRVESFRRLIYRPLIKKYNEEMKLTSTMEGFLKVTEPKHREMVAKVYADEVAKLREKYKIAVKIDKDVDSPMKAFSKSVAENVVRNNMPLADLFSSAEEMVSGMGMKAGDAAKIFKVSDGALSQYRKANKLVPTLREVLVTPEKGEQISESDLVKLKEDVTALCNELERRMKLNENHTQAASLSHLREFSGRVVVKDGEERKLTREQMLVALCKLVGADPKTRKFGKDSQHENYKLFVENLKSYEDMTKRNRELAALGQTADAAPGDGTAVAGATPAVDQAEQPAGGTVAGLAEAQAAGAAAVSSGNATPVAAGTPVTPPSGPLPSGSAEAAALNADAKVAPAPGATPAAGTPAPVTPVTAATATVSAGELADLDDDLPPEAGVATPEEIGKKKAKVQQAPTSEYKIKSVDSILRAALDHAKLALQTAEENQVLSLVNVAADAKAATELFNMLGADARYKRWNEAVTTYIEDVDQYLEELEQWATVMHRKFNTPKPPRSLVRPKLVVVGEEAEVPGQDLVVGEDDEIDPILDEPTDEDLADIDAELANMDAEGDIELEDEAALKEILGNTIDGGENA